MIAMAAAAADRAVWLSFEHANAKGEYICRMMSDDDLRVRAFDRGGDGVRNFRSDLLREGKGSDDRSRPATAASDIIYSVRIPISDGAK